jgi:hypothetical protein
VEADTIVSGDYSFKVWITEQLPYYCVRLGPSWENACVDISVPAQGNILSDNTACLDKVKYQPCCTSNGKALETGSGGSAVMVKAAIKWIFSRYPHVLRFKLDDTSTVTCLDGTRLNVSLAALMLSYAGKTWYEREIIKHHDSLRIFSY